MNVLVAAQDPGGANAVAPVAEALVRRGHTVVATVEGAARDVFLRRNLPLGNCNDPSVVLLATSGGESVEKRVTEQLRGTVPTIAVLDFWSNYWQRFSSPGTKDFAYLPDVVCVMDTVARDEMIADGFAPEHLRVTGNPHFDHFADGITHEKEDAHRVLFISQPIREDALVPGFPPAASDEYEALETTIAALPSTHRLCIRLHPREPADKYERYLGDRVQIALEPTLEEALSVSGLVVGVASQVLLQAAAADKKVLCYEPVLEGPDELVSNRIGVTTRIESPEELRAALHQYAEGKWPYQTKPVHEVWPAGATERVIVVLDELVATDASR
ncbi:hypothetical protein COU19_00445 [Candidatus Kaiserbacteria bacterium CG10_big_fil_rev_8_21_14_0_10_56_12]|uniref:UDP-N-acetylglucosamine 2-epimerase domain-containing protein n=1 Tax=Candidatus Kaiserbacteria bacterium CG10_big_fil_rev_8_21_14_0_10_56_12 TaxID=1974611 RepID=A0A2H0UCL7_9BACT|nr:MAG: hypothetical protein COU19_00445 [Candidatus Kaiserbacteria bacterium CG10_big_fil_rev_8_21_14_0_10_56_12]